MAVCCSQDFKDTMYLAVNIAIDKVVLNNNLRKTTLIFKQLPLKHHPIRHFNHFTVLRVKSESCAVFVSKL